MTLTVGSLFSGIGGFDLGLQRAGMKVRWQSEIDPYASAVLKKHWPDVPNLGDIRSVQWDAVEPVDLICGGFPCQPYSVAGKGLASADERDLWPEYARIVRELRPRWVVAENVPALRTRGYDRVADDLEAAGYAVWPFVVGADDVGAPHRRKRVWIVAHTKELRSPLGYAGSLRTGRTALESERRGSAHGPAPHADAQRCREQRQPHHADQQGASGREPDRCDRARVSADAEHNRRERRDQEGQGPAAAVSHGEGRHAADALSSRLPGGERAQLPGGQRHDEGRATAESRRTSPWHEGPPVPAVCELDDGIPAGLVRHRRPALAALGNALLPQIAEIIGRAIVRAAA